jgi:hypothetical protein
MTGNAIRTRALASAILLGLAGSTAGANESPEPPRKTTHVESVEVRAYYLCDGYDTYGDASFYDCARRFFREGVLPNEEAQLEGTWYCVSAVNGPTANYEQTIKVGHYQKGKLGTDTSVDVLLVQKIFEKNPSPKKMYRGHFEPRSVNLTPGTAVIGKIDRNAADWTSTSWAYVQLARPLKYFGGGGPVFYETRSAFRFREDRLLIEHVAPAETREQMWEDLTTDPRSTEARQRVRDKRAQGAVPTVADAIQLFDELVNDEIYQDGNPFRTEWTEQSLKSAASIALYPAFEGDEAEWSFPMAYSECRRK